MTISSNATLPPFPYTGTFTANWQTQISQQYVYKLGLSPGSYQISVLPDLLTLTTAVGAVTTDDIQYFGEEALISSAYIVRTVDWWDSSGNRYSGQNLVATLQSRPDTLATQAMESAGYYANYGSFDYYDTTVTIEPERTVTYLSGSGETYTDDYYLYVEGYNYSYSLATTGMDIPLSGRFLVTLGNPTGQRTQTWGDGWLNVQSLFETYTAPVTPPPAQDSMLDVVVAIPSSSAWSAQDSDGQTFSPAYVIGADGTWYQTQSVDGTAMVAPWSSGTLKSQLYDNLSESVYEIRLNKVAEYGSMIGLPGNSLVESYEDAREVKTLLGENSSRILGLLNDGMQGVILTMQGGTFDAEAYWNSIRYAGRDCLKDIGDYVSGKIFGSNTTASQLVSTLNGAALDVAYSGGDTAAINSGIDTALRNFAATVAVEAADKSEIVQRTIDAVGSRLKADAAALDAAKILADASELGAVLIDQALPYSIDTIENGARWLGLYREVPLQEQTVNSVSFGAGSIGGTLTGAALNDVLYAGDCGGTLSGEGGNDLLIGGNGTDTALFSGNRATYALTQASPHSLQIRGADGSDTLMGVERLVFTDGTLALDTGGGETAGEVYRLYKAAFSRTPDNGGLKYWIGVMDAGAGLTQVADGFVESPEFASIYGINSSNDTLVTRFYQNVLNRLPEQIGYDYWMGQLNNDLMTRSEVLAAFSESAENQANLVGVLQEGVWFV